MVTNQKSKGNLVVDGIYTHSHQVENNKDNDGGTHPGSLQYYRTEFPGNHTLIIFETDQPFSDAFIKLKKMIRDNVYI